MNQLAHLVNGTSMDGGVGEVAVVNPATQETIATFAAAGAIEVDAAVAAARAALVDPAWGESTPAERSDALRRLADAVEDQGAELCHLESIDTGKPLKKELLDAELPLILDNLRFFAAAARDVGGARSGEYTRGKTSIFRREPIGVAALIPPWNYPLMLAVWKVGAALAAGCTAVLKPAPEAPLTALRLAELALESGLPPGVLNVVLGGDESGRFLTRHHDVDMVSLTGSTETGRDVLVQSAGNLKRVDVELGGKAPVLVFADADLSAVAETVAFGVAVNSGQDCVAATRVYIEAPSYSEFRELLGKAVDGLSMGDPLAVDTDLGPLISEEHRRRVEAYVTRATHDGGRVLVGGGRPPGFDRGFYFAPTLLEDIPVGTPLATEEVFGPVAYLESFDDEDKAVELANAGPYGLAASVWTADIGRAMRCARRLRSGTVWVNDYLTFVSELPHSGVKQSGNGTGLSAEAVARFQTTKHVVVASSE